MSRILDLADIQGNILRPYGALGFPKARTLFVHFTDPLLGRAFVEALRPKITTASRWPTANEAAADATHPRIKTAIQAAGEEDYPGEVMQERPEVALNIAFTFKGLYQLQVPIRTLQALPQEFIDGMAPRASILGDPVTVPGTPEDKRDEIWQKSVGVNAVHAMISLNAQMDKTTGQPVEKLAQMTQWVVDQAAQFKVTVLPGNGRDKGLWHDSSAILKQMADGSWVPTREEHFGYTDGFGDPVFAGQFPLAAEQIAVPGRGKIAPDGSWQPLATGEFLLGHADEAQEVPGAAMPNDFSRNCTFMAWRKLHENVKAFKEHIRDEAPDFAAVTGTPAQEASDTLMAKIAGRWPDGVPLENFPSFAERTRFNAALAAAKQAKDLKAEAELVRQYTDFRYGDAPGKAKPGPDLDGLRCPVTSHMRRANPRDMLNPAIDLPNTPANRNNGSALVNRRRILRRGLPYGACDPAAPDNEGEHGILFMAVCASLFRQFEFLQQQWIHYGLDFNAGNDTCPMIGNHNVPGVTAKFVVPGEKPFISAPLPQFVEFRGGDYFFVPSMTSLRMIGMGIVDPT